MTALEDLKEEFGLNDQQLQVLPVLDSEIDLELQNDSHRIPKFSPGKRTPHPYRLYIGNHDGDARYVHLFRKRSGRPMVLEIAGMNGDVESYEKWNEMYYQTVSDLAYPTMRLRTNRNFVRSSNSTSSSS